MEELEQRVAALEGALNNLFTYTLPYWENKITNLESIVQDLENEISGGSGTTENVYKLIDILYDFSKAKYNIIEYSQAEIDFYKAVKELKGV